MIFDILKDETNLVEFCKTLHYEDFDIIYSLFKDINGVVYNLEVHKRNISRNWMQRIFTLSKYDKDEDVKNQEVLDFIKIKIRKQKLERIIENDDSIVEEIDYERFISKSNSADA